jgi:Leucine-rich repeat (LRR) protein
MAALAVLGTCGCGGVAVPPHAKPLPEAIVAAWKKAGAEVCWIRVGKFGSMRSLPEKEGVAYDLPALRFSAWKAGVLATLPAPEEAFALFLNGTHVTDAGLKELAGLKGLKTLSLRGTHVTDAGLKELAGLKNLQWLNLSGTHVTDAGLKELAGLKGLKTLSLSGIRVTDAWLKELAGLKGLKTLDLSTTRVTDAGLKELAALKQLQHLYLRATQVTDAGLRELRKELPSCRIEH